MLNLSHISKPNPPDKLAIPAYFSGQVRPSLKAPYPPMEFPATKRSFVSPEIQGKKRSHNSGSSSDINVKYLNPYFISVYHPRCVFGITTAIPCSAAYRSIDVFLVQMVWLSVIPCRRYNTGYLLCFSTCPIPICPSVSCGRITSIWELIPRTSEKKST